MIKLYYKAGTCSLASHITLLEAGLKFTAISVDLATHQLADGSDYYQINPTGMVPLLVLENGERLSEGPAILQYLADQAPERQLAPASGTMERYHLQETLNFIATEIHKSYGPLFRSGESDAVKAAALQKLRKMYTLLNQKLSQQPYLGGEHFGVADAYLFTTLGWGQFVKMDFSGLDALQAFIQRVKDRPSVREALTAEGQV